MLALVRFAPLPALLVLAPIAASQSLWLDRDDRTVLTIEAHRPIFDDWGRVWRPNRTGTPLDSMLAQAQQPAGNALVFLTIRKGFSSGAALILDVPFAYASEPSIAGTGFQPMWRDSTTGDSMGYRYPIFELENRFRFLSPGLMFEWGNPHSGWRNEIGGRAPLGPENWMAVYAGFADVERALAFDSRAGEVHYALILRPPDVPGVHGSGRLAAIALIGDRGDSGAAAYASWRGMLVAQREGSRFQAGFAGLITADPRFDGDRTLTQFELVAEHAYGAWRPALHVRVWMDGNMRDVAPYVIGLRLEWRPSPEAS